MNGQELNSQDQETQVDSQDQVQISLQVTPVSDALIPENNNALIQQIQDLQNQIQQLQTLHMHEKEFLNDTINKKSLVIDTMRVKLKRYEFCVKEAILFLGKPIVSYHEWLNTPGNSSSTSSPKVKDNAETASKQSKLNNGSSVDRKNSLTPQYMAEKQQLMSNANNLSKSMSTAPTATTINMEIQCFECVRLALNYLVNTQNSISNESLDPTKSNSSEASTTANRLVSDNELQNIQPMMDRLSILTGKKNTHEKTKSDSPNDETFETDNTLKKTVSVSSSRSRSETVKNSSPLNQLHIQSALSEEEDVDLGVKTFKSDYTSSSSSKSCSMCRDRMLHMDRLQDEIKNLNGQLTSTRQELDSEKQIKERIQLSKDILEQELEDLTEQLFDQANNMVIEESRNREELESKNHDLRVELKVALKRAEGRDEDVKELKKIITALKVAKSRSLSMASFTASASYLGAASGLPKGIFGFESSSHHIADTIFVDGIIYSELQDYLSISTLAGSQPLEKALPMLLGTNFVKRCIFEDIEPCLYYHYSFNGISKTIGSGGMSSSFKKKLLDFASKGHIEILTSGTPGSDTTELNKIPSSKTKCTICTVVRDCAFKIRLGEKDKGKFEDFGICRNCRDRISACTDFFAYLQFLRVSKPNYTILSIFRCFMWLKRRISSARIGSCTLFEGDFASIISAYSIHGDWEHNVNIQS